MAEKANCWLVALIVRFLPATQIAFQHVHILHMFVIHISRALSKNDGKKQHFKSISKVFNCPSQSEKKFKNYFQKIKIKIRVYSTC